MKRERVIPTLLCAVLLVPFLLLPRIAHSAEWLVLPTTGFVSGDPDLTLTMPFVLQPNLSVKSRVAADLKWIEVSVPFISPLPSPFDGVVVCYSAPNQGTFISQIRLAEYIGPAFATVKHDDGTDLTSTTDTCFFSPVANYTPAGAVNLSLRLNFANPAHIINIGAVVLHFKP
jgi:hypothetical protein